MFDPNKLAAVRSGAAFQASVSPSSLDMMSVAELLALKNEVEMRLPASSLTDMDLEEELVHQYQKVKMLQDEVLTDGETPANQKAQVANSVASTLQQLVTMQTKFHTSERLKEIEGRLIKTLNRMPEQYMTEFFAWYENSTEGGEA